MKTRKSFISNSSSSSFILVGIILTGEELEKHEEFIETNKLDIVYDCDDDILVGNHIASAIEEESGGMFDLSEIDSLKSILNQISKNPVKIYYGNEQC